MSPLSGFILVIIVITFQITLYTIKRIQEPLKPNFSNLTKTLPSKASKRNYWQNAELTNGRLAMMGLFAIILNYGLFGWIIPGFF